MKLKPALYMLTYGLAPPAFTVILIPFSQFHTLGCLNMH